MSEITYNDPPRRPKWVLPAIGAIAVLLVCAVAVSVGVSVGLGVNAVEGVHTGLPATDDEKFVAHTLLRCPDEDCKDVWIEWGPNDDKGLTHFKDPAHLHIIRVAYYSTPKEGPRTHMDQLFTIDPNPPKASGPSPGGIRRVVLPDLPADNPSGRRWLADGIAEKKAAEARALQGH